MSTVNGEVGYSSTAQTGFNNSRVRNLANKTSSGTTIAMQDMRFGLKLPGRFYNVNNIAEFTEFSVAAFGTAEAYVDLDLFSDGTGTYTTYTTGGGTTTAKSFTWMKSGDSASNYTAELVMNSGDNPTSGSATGTELALSTSRTWVWRAIRTVIGVDSKTATATLKIRRSGVLGPSRDFSIDVYAEIF
jgi:hypothetical protein